VSNRCGNCKVMSMAEYKCGETPKLILAYEGNASLGSEITTGTAKLWL